MILPCELMVVPLVSFLSYTTFLVALLLYHVISQVWEFVCGVRAKDTFESTTPDDLSFVVGELMDIVKNPTDQPKWVARNVSKCCVDEI